jgi:hypothetical protein
MTLTPAADDPPLVRKAIEWLTREGIPFERPGTYQLKCGPFNFYPTRGTIILDGHTKRLPQRGLDSFIALLRQRGWPGDDTIHLENIPPRRPR